MGGRREGTWAGAARSARQAPDPAPLFPLWGPTAQPTDALVLTGGAQLLGSAA